MITVQKPPRKKASKTQVDKITPEIIKNIKNESSDTTFSHLSKKYNISAYYVKKIVNNEFVPLATENKDSDSDSNSSGESSGSEKKVVIINRCSQQPDESIKKF